MSHPWKHAVSSAKKHGGEPRDYLDIHQWFDESKAHHADPRHRALRHHTEGIFLCEEVFGEVIENSDGDIVPVRIIAEQHVHEDLGEIPPASKWLEALEVERWMLGIGDPEVATMTWGNTED